MAGATWIGANWFIYKGLVRYGMVDEAKKIYNASRVLIEKSGFREYFHPETGEGIGAENFTWGGLVLDMAGLTEGDNQEHRDAEEEEEKRERRQKQPDGVFFLSV